MKKILICISIFITLIFTGCAAAYEGTDTAQQDDKVTQDFQQIEGYDNLYYCTNTNVVYWIGGSYSVNVFGDDYTTSYMTPYYAPNGYPYIFNTMTGTLQQIDK